MVRGYAAVFEDGDMWNSSPGVTVTHPAEGTYCVAVPGVSGNPIAAVAMPVTGAGGWTSPGNLEENSFVEWAGSDVLCPDNTVAINTLKRAFARNDQGHIIDTFVEYADASFMVLIP